ncbi:MAG: thrombospondin type 3 repeat-containing protein [Verrucomicrobiota bacterium]
MDRVIYLIAWRIALLSCLIAAARADFVAYTFFGAAGSSVSNVTRLGIAGRLILNQPIVFESFDSGAEGPVSLAGWSARQFTDPIAGHAGNNLNDPLSDAYLGWVLISQSRLQSVFGGERLRVAPGQELNGAPITALLSGNLLYAESDLRSGSQVQYIFSPAYDLTGKHGIVLAFNSAYTQNQDSMTGVEFSLDGGQSWKPVICMIDRDDIVRLPDGTVDAVVTLTSRRTDVATYRDPATGTQQGGYYGAFLAAPISQNLAPYISGRINDNQVESKRLEVFRLPEADDHPRVLFRLFQAGTASWFWGIDNWGLYQVPCVDQAAVRLKNYKNGEAASVTATLSVSGRPLSAMVPSPTAVGVSPAAGTEAKAAFEVSLDSAGNTVLYPGTVHALDLEGLDPQKAYELVLYSDNGAGGGATGNRLSYTLSGAETFRNASSTHAALAVLSGDQNQTVTIDVTDNSRADRGFICRFTGLRSGSDGEVRISFSSAETTCLTALKLVETTVQTVALAAAPEVTENAATLTGVLNTETAAPVYLYWGLTNGGTASNLWQHAQFLGHFSPGQFTASLTDLAAFKQYFYAFQVAGPAEQAWTAAASFRPQIQGILYATGFEPTEAIPFVPGNLHGQDRQGIWRVSRGDALVQQSRAAHGLQSVQSGQCTIDVALTNTAPVLWVDAFFMESGTTNPPIIPTNVVSSVVFFSATGGILALDGDGAGGGSFVPVTSSFPTNEFVRVTIRNDYQAKRYDVWIDGTQRRAGLGFKNNSVQKLSGAQRRAVHPSYMDDFSVSVWGLDQDRDGDGLVDLDEAKFYGSYPLLADSDGDGAGDSQEVLAGTDPANPASLFALKIESDAQRNQVVKVPTITGRSYTLQWRDSLSTGKWEDAPNATNIPGDGREKVFLETSDGQNYFYRGVIINR